MPLSELYPDSGRTVEARGLYLAHRLHTLGSEATPFVYANFVQSLDGRIGLHDPRTGRDFLPESLFSANDFRLFLELQAQADCLITHGGYLRAIAEGRLDDILQVGVKPQTNDLAQWRREQGLSRQPAVVVASASLDFAMPPSLDSSRAFIATGNAADSARVRDWERKGIAVIRAGQRREVEGAPLISALAEKGYKSIYLVAGPLMLAAMLRDKMLSRLYVTISHQILGGEDFHTIFRGSTLVHPARLKLRSLYYDPESVSGQCFAQFDCAR